MKQIVYLMLVAFSFTELITAKPCHKEEIIEESTIISLKKALEIFDTPAFTQLINKVVAPYKLEEVIVDVVKESRYLQYQVENFYDVNFFHYPSHAVIYTQTFYKSRLNKKELLAGIFAKMAMNKYPQETTQLLINNDEVNPILKKIIIEEFHKSTIYPACLQ